MVAVPFATTAIALFFTLSLVDQFLERRRPYQGIWALGMGLYGLASLLQGLWQLGVTGEVVFRLWYITGGMLVAAYLGMGTLYLHAPRPVAHGIFGGLVVLTVVGAVLALVTPLQTGADLRHLYGQALASVDPQTGMRYFPAGVGALTAFLNTAGSLALIGGAVYSAVVFAQRRQAGYRVVSSVLIALGAFLSAAGGTLERFNFPQAHTLALLLGIVVIYVGFLRSREVIAVFRFPFARGASRPGVT
ncbi:hypothetical protein HRbin23_01356 [bacterium HR23]|nr:hypothetical protein HRbin23_01356 [bacterium HR23]